MVLFYWWSVDAKSLSRTVAEILSIKHFGATTLTLSDHVTSTVTSPLDSAAERLKSPRYKSKFGPLKPSHKFNHAKVKKDLMFSWASLLVMGPGTVYRLYVPLSRWRCHWNRRWSFPIGHPLTPCAYLPPLPRY